MSEERDRRIFDILGMDLDKFQQCMLSVQELSLQKFVDVAPQMAPEHQDIMLYRLNEESRIACVNWRGKRFITGTDIVRFLLYRYQLYAGEPPANMKKFEEGIFSDLRRLSPPQDCQLETTRSDFLVYLFNTDCVRSKKKQKVFFWASFARCANALFCDAFEREMARIEMARAVGMTIDEFIKSGIVPTGGAGSNMDSSRLGYDWTLVRPGSSDYRVQNMDQIHVIRNDIANCFARNLRQPVGKRGALITEEVEVTIQEDLSKRTGGADVSQLRKSAPVDAVSESPADSNDDGGDSDFSPYVRRRRPPPQPKSSPLTPRASSSGGRSTRPTPSRSSQPLAPSTPTRATPPPPAPTLDPYYAPDDNYSVSTLSSDDEEDRSFLPRNFQHRAPAPNNRQPASIYSRHHTFRYSIWPPAATAKHPAAVIPPNYAYPPSKNRASAADVVVDRMQTPMEYMRSDVKLPRPASVQLDVAPATEDIIGTMLRLSSPPEIHSVVYHNVASPSASSSSNASPSASKGKRPMHDGDDVMMEPILDSPLDATSTTTSATAGTTTSPPDSKSEKRQKVDIDFSAMAGWLSTSSSDEATVRRMPGAQEAANILLGLSRG